MPLSSASRFRHARCPLVFVTRQGLPEGDPACDTSECRGTGAVGMNPTVDLCLRAESRRACTPPRERPSAPSGGRFCNV